MIALNAAFDQQLLLGDEGYESGSDTMDLPTSLRKTPRIHHVSSIEHASFDPETVIPWHMPQTPPRPVWRWLSFSSTDDNTPHTPRSTPSSTPEYSEDKEEEEDFQMVTLNDDHWTSEEIPERTLHSWAWLTTWVMPIPMPLCELPDSILHRQPGFKWHFGLWGLYGYIQQWGHTGTWRYATLKETLV